MNNIVKIGIIGLGTVGSSLLSLITKNRELLKLKTSKDIVVTKGVVKNIRKKRNLNIDIYDDINEILDDDSIDIVVELTGDIKESFNIAKRAFLKNKSLITANKAMLAYHRYELKKLIKDNSFAYEASVCGAIPAIKILRESLSSNNILEIKGIINGTSNYILTKMTNEGLSYKEVLKEAKDLGYAEADESFDVGGFDAAHKLLILASIAYDIDAKPEDILIQGIEDIKNEDISFVKEFSYKIKLLALAKPNLNNKVELRVCPMLIPFEDTLANIEGVNNAINIKGDYSGDVFCVGAGAGGDATASAVASDLVDIINFPSRSLFGFNNELKNYSLLEIDEISSKYYLRMTLTKNENLEKVLGLFLSFNIEVKHYTLKDSLQIITNLSKEFKIKNVLKNLSKDDLIHKESLILRIKD